MRSSGDGRTSLDRTLEIHHHVLVPRARGALINSDCVVWGLPYLYDIAQSK
jgi:hypothetical protein